MSSELVAAEPIPFTTTRWRCPFCRRTASSKSRMNLHISRCWHNPAVHGCKTCKHFEAWHGDWGDECDAGVSLAGHGDQFDDDYVRPGPIVGCDKWELRNDDEGDEGDDAEPMAGPSVEPESSDSTESTDSTDKPAVPSA